MRIQSFLNFFPPPFINEIFIPGITKTKIQELRLTHASNCVKMDN